MLIIQKLIKVLDDVHFDIFVEHLWKIKANYPRKLVESIHRCSLTERTSEELCESVYGDSEEKTKRKFFQLAHHTFKLSSFLSRNYPGYLFSVVSSIQNKINSGQINNANKLLELTIDMTYKIEDFNVMVQCLQISSLQSVIHENENEALKIHLKIKEALEELMNINSIYIYLRNELNHKLKNYQITLEEHKAFFNQFSESKSLIVKILCRYGTVYSANYLNDPEFYEQSTLALLDKAQDSLNKYDYVVFPYLEDLRYKISYFKMKILLNSSDQQLLLEESDKISSYGGEVLFWENYLNQPQMYTLAIQTSYYTSKYFANYRVYKADGIDVEDKANIDRLTKTCEDLLEQDIWQEKEHIFKLITLKTIYSFLLLLGDDKSIKKSIDSLETLLIMYQQIPFQKYLDGIFVNLVIGYFSLREYDKVSESYKRFRKLTDGVSLSDENDITIHGFYYMAQWNSTKRKQYLSKFEKTLDRTSDVPNLQVTKKILLELAEFFKMPIL